MRSKPASAINNTECGIIPLLTYLQYETSKETMTLVPDAMDAYNIITGEEPEAPPIDIDYHDGKIEAAKAKTTIHLSCCPVIQFLLKGLRSPGAIGTTLRARLDNSRTDICRSTIQRQFRACRLLKDQTP